MKKLIIILVTLIAACSSSNEKKAEEKGFESKDFYADSETKTDPEHEKKGIGKFTNVELSTTLDKAMAESGQKVYDLKCSACHRLTNEKLVGPGWKEVTTRRKAEWIMNFATNTDEMIDKDPQAQAMLEECMVRMPNQNLADEEARNILEYMRKNDGLK